MSGFNNYEVLNTQPDYDPKAQVPFPDPIIRCDSCQTLVRRQTIHSVGCCNKCGNRRFRNVLVIQPDEMEKCREWNLDPEFLALFEEKDELEPRTSNPDTDFPGKKGDWN